MLLPLALMGCGSGGTSEAEEKKLHQELAGPPSLAGMKGHHPGGANQKSKEVMGATTTGTPPPTTG